MKPIVSPRNSRHGLFAVAAIVIGALAGAAIWFGYGQPAVEADPDNAAQVALGARIYATHCAACHGADLRGQENWRSRKPDGRLPAPPHDETGHSWHHPDDHLFRITRNGLKPPLAPAGYQSDMPAFAGTLTDAEIWAVLAYIKSTWPPAIRSRQSAIDASAKQ